MTPKGLPESRVSSDGSLRLARPRFGLQAGLSGQFPLRRADKQPDAPTPPPEALQTVNPSPEKKTKDQIAQAYKSEPWWYDVRGFFILTFAYNSSLMQQVRFFGPNFGARHLDVACGTGTLLELILRWRRWRKLPKGKIVGIDYAESMLAGARHRFAGQSDLEFRLADVAEMPFADAEFETANVANAVHCFPDVDGGLRDIHRVLRPGGTLALNVLLYPSGGWPLKNIAQRINDWGIRKGILYTPYQRDDVRRRVLDAGFVIVLDGRVGNCYNVLARKAG